MTLAQETAIGLLKWQRRYNNITHVILNDAGIGLACSESEADEMSNEDDAVYSVDELITEIEGEHA